MLDATTKTIPVPSNRTPLAVGAWLTLGCSLALSNVLSSAPQLAPAFILGSAILWTLLYVRVASVRTWADAFPMRTLVAMHALRLPIGALLLWEGSTGRLSQLFAQRAGWGDMAVGIAAIGVALVASTQRRAVRMFAWFGLVDILIAFGTAMYLLFVARDDLMLDAIGRQPYPFLPLALVPIVVVTHLLMLARTRRS